MVSINIDKYNLSLQSLYDFYESQSKQTTFSLIFPILNDLTSGVYYIIDREFLYQDSKYLKSKVSNRLESTFTIGFIPQVQLSLKFGKKTITDVPDPQYIHQIGVTYLSPSECWGLKFAWNKSYEDISDFGQFLSFSRG